MVLPDDPIPAADAIVGVGHPLNYLPDEAAVDRALVAIAGALRPGGVLAIDLCDLEYGEARREHSQLQAGSPTTGRSSPNSRFRRPITSCGRWRRSSASTTDSWRRDDERHDNVLIDTAPVPALLAQPRRGGDARSGLRRRGAVGRALRRQGSQAALIAARGSRKNFERGSTTSAPAARAASAPASSTCGPKHTSRAAGATARTAATVGRRTGPGRRSRRRPRRSASDVTHEDHIAHRRA